MTTAHGSYSSSSQPSMNVSQSSITISIVCTLVVSKSRVS